MELVCFDTQVLIWCIQKKASPTQEHMIPRACAFLRSLQEKKTKVMIPSVVIAEFLAKIPYAEHNTYLSLFKKHFLISPFDAVSACLFAKIWQEKANGQSLEQLKQIPDVNKTTIKADCLIVATALASKADCIYSHDRNSLRAFANGIIDVREIEIIPMQMEMNYPQLSD